MDFLLDPGWPAPDPGVFEWDPWHPPDHQRPTFVSYAAGPTLCRVQWMAFDPNTPAGNETEDTYAGVEEAYRSLPNLRAAETIILAHVALTHKIVEKIAMLVCPDAMRRERSRRRPCASIAEEWFSIGLLKLVEVAQGDPQRNRPGLRSIGEQHGWEDWDRPRHIAKYLGESVKNEIWRSHADQENDRLRTLCYLLKRHPGQKTGKIKRGEIAEEDRLDCDGGSFVTFHEETPDRIAAEREALDMAGGDDLFDRLLLTMKYRGLLSEDEMGEQLGLDRNQVQYRLRRIRKAMEGVLELPRNKTFKRKSRKLPPVLSADEALDSPNGDLFDRLLAMLRAGVLTEVEMAARLGWTRDQVERRLYIMREAKEQWARLPGLNITCSTR